jgi:ATP/maltotriose-dependent transcriptional regulator MalT
MVAYYRGNVARAKALSLTAQAETALASDFWYLQMNLAWFLALLGDWDEAEFVVGQAIERAKHAKDFWLLAPLMTTATDLAVWKGNFDTALDLGEQVSRVASEAYAMDRLGALAVLGLTFLEQGRPEQAAKLLATAPELAASSSEKNEVHQSLLVLTESLLLMGNLEMAIRLIDQVREYLHYNMSWKTAVDRVHSQLYLIQREPSRALHVIEEWLLEPSEIPYEQGRVHECAAEAYLALGDREEAAIQGFKAEMIYSRLGAAERKKKIEHWLKANGPRRRGRPRSRVVLNLTAREVEILTLVGSGHSNNEIAAKLFISPGTVKKHVSNIKDKTFVRHRRELIPIALRVVAVGETPPDS